MRGEIGVLRTRIASLLESNLLPYFTDHSITHCDRLTEIVDSLVSRLREALSVREAVVLYFACYLHDIGVQFENFKDFECIKTDGLSDRWDDLSVEEKREEIRNRHNLVSAELVIKSIGDGLNLGLYLREEYDPHLIAALCEAHTLDTLSTRYGELMKSPRRLVRMRLLSGLLRVADILDETSQRALPEKANTLNLPLESKVHWWRHYYTREADIDPSTSRILVVFEFPPDRREEYAKVIPRLQFPAIEQELLRHREPFAEAGLSWYVDKQIDEYPYSQAKDMPPDVFEAMKAALITEESKPKPTPRTEVFVQFEEANHQIQVILDDINALDESSADDQKAQLYERAADIADGVKAKSSTRSLLSSAFSLYMKGTSYDNLLNVALRLIPLELQEGSPSALHQLQELLELPEIVSKTPEKLIQLRIMQVEGLARERRIKEAIVSANALLSELSSSNWLPEVVATLLEVIHHFGLDAMLQGNLTLPTSFKAPSEDLHDLPSSAARITVCFAERSARTELEQAASAIRQSLDVHGIDQPNSRLLLLNTLARILYAWHQEQEAAGTLQLILDENLCPDLKIENQIRRNLLVVRRRMDMVGAFQEQRAQEDREELSGAFSEGPEIRDIAASHVARKKSNLAFFELWNELLNAGRSYDWHRRWKAHSAIAEFLTTEGDSAWIPSAVLHGICGQEKELGSALQAMFEKHGTEEACVMAARMLRLSAIPSEARTSLNILSQIAEFIPDTELGNVIRYCLSFLDETIAWKALGKFGKRIPLEMWKDIVAYAEEWDFEAADPFHSEAIVTLLGSIQSGTDSALLDQCVQLLLTCANSPRVKHSKQIYYPDVLASLLQISRRYGQTTRDLVGNALFPEGPQNLDVERVQYLCLYAPAKGIQESQEAINQAERIIRSEVQRVSKDLSAPEVVPHMMHIKTEGPDGVVHRWLTVPASFRFILGIREKLSEDQVWQIAQAALDLLKEDDNLLPNRLGLCSFLDDLHDVLTTEQKVSIFTAIESMVIRGIRDFLLVDQEGVTDVFGRYSFNMGSVDELVAKCLTTAGHMLEGMASEQHRLHTLLDRLLDSESEVIVAGLIEALEFATTISPRQFSVLLVNLVSSSDLCSFASARTLFRRQDDLDAFKGTLVLELLTQMASMADSSRRANAAYLAAKLKGRWNDPSMTMRFEQLLERLSQDLAFSVRLAASGEEEDE